jgi:hypothetical protein
MPARAGGYGVFLLPEAIKDMDGLDDTDRLRVIAVLDEELEDQGSSRTSVQEQDGRTYFKTTLTTGHTTLHRPLTADELKKREQKLRPGEPAYFIFGVDGDETPDEESVEQAQPLGPDA